MLNNQAKNIILEIQIINMISHIIKHNNAL